jgi:hypothetical protein
MKLHGVIDLGIQGEKIYRDPGTWDKIKKAFGGQPDLFTGKRKAAVEASQLVDGVIHAFKQLGIQNAISLVIDDRCCSRIARAIRTTSATCSWPFTSRHPCSARASTCCD